MKKILRFLKAVISLHKYPRYLVDIYVNLILPKIWRFQGVNLGEGVVWLGKPIIAIAKNSSISIGNGCVLCSRSSQTALGVNHSVVLRTLHFGSELRIGSEVRMSGTTICAVEKVTIGNRCVIGSNVTIVDTDFHSLDPGIRSSAEDYQFALHGPVEIGEDVFIGGGAYILKGVKIGSGAVIGAGSVVTRDVPELGIVAGNPARLLRIAGKSIIHTRKSSDNHSMQS